MLQPLCPKHVSLQQGFLSQDLPFGSNHNPTLVKRFWVGGLSFSGAREAPVLSPRAQVRPITRKHKLSFAERVGPQQAHSFLLVLVVGS